VAKRPPGPQWLTRVVVDAVHDDQVREHGGLPGIRDQSLLESALANGEPFRLPAHESRRGIDAETKDFVCVRC
jgi:hypothetical protein